MNESFFLQCSYIGASYKLEISRNKYESILKSQNIIFEVLSIEQKYDLMMSNYLEFEDEIIKNLSYETIFSTSTSPEMRHRMAVLNRRAANVFTSCRLYVDHTVHHVRAAFGKNSKMEKDFNTAKNDKYDTYIEYRTIEALRNYVQHYDLPINGLSTRSKRILSENSHKIRHTMDLFVSIEKLEKDNTFKKSVLKELRNVSGKISLIKYIRVYIDCLSDIHFHLREWTSDEIFISKDCIIKSIEEFCKKSTDELDVHGLSIYRYHNDKPHHENYLISDPVDLLKFYLEKNSNKANSARSYVSNETFDE